MLETYLVGAKIPLTSSEDPCFNGVRNKNTVHFEYAMHELIIMYWQEEGAKAGEYKGVSLHSNAEAYEAFRYLLPHSARGS